MMWNSACPLFSGGTMGVWGWAAMGLNLLFWVGLIVGLVYLVSRLARGSGSNLPAATAPAGPVAGSEGALEIARSRYARGEIGREEYVQLVQDLQS